MASFLSHIPCRLVNAIKAGSVAKINEPATMPFKKMENIANAIKGIRALGMQEFEMFGTPDLFEEKNMKQVINSIHALGRLMQTKTYAHLGLPKLGIKVVEKNVSTAHTMTTCATLDWTVHRPLLTCSLCRNDTSARSSYGKLAWQCP